MQLRVVVVFFAALAAVCVTRTTRLVKVERDLTPPPETTMPPQNTTTINAEKISPLDYMYPDRSYVGGNGEKRWFLGVCAGTKGSGTWLREWVELQMLAGVDHLWLVNDNDNETRDGTEEIMAYYERVGFLTILPGPMPKAMKGCEVATTKNWMHNCIAPKYCARHVASSVDWLVFADTDEFIYPHVGCDLSHYVKNTCNQLQSHVAIRWERFGTNGFSYHPAGLMTENFMESGGNCAHMDQTPGRYHGLKMCRNQPFGFCIECRHMKVMFNTKNCLEEQHFGMVHWPVNTTIWKNARHSKNWIASPGKNSNFLNEKCFEVDIRRDGAMCSKWLRSKGASDPVQFTSECCSAGIGYNHYGTKSMQFFQRKKMRVSDDLRGLRTDIEVIDSNGIISYSILRFVRALRARFTSLGHPISANVQFIGNVFTETNYRYTPLSHLGTTNTTSLTLTSDSCATSCSQTPTCMAFTYSIFTKSCSFLTAPREVTLPTGSLGRRQWPRTHIPANRRWELNYISGVVLRDPECPVRM